MLHVGMFSLGVHSMLCFPFYPSPSSLPGETLSEKPEYRGTLACFGFVPAGTLPQQHMCVVLIASLIAPVKLQIKPAW